MKFLKSIFFVVLLFNAAPLVFAQNQEPLYRPAYSTPYMNPMGAPSGNGNGGGKGGGNNGVPLDGGTGLLIAAGVALGTWKVITAQQISKIKARS